MVITILNIYGVKLVAVINNTGVLFEILGMVVFALIMAIVHNNQGIGVHLRHGRLHPHREHFLVGMFMSLFVVYGFDTAGTLAEETKNPRAGVAEGDPRLDRGRVRDRRDLPARDL